MIESKDLRIGNWVLYNVWGDGKCCDWIKISAITKDYVESEITSTATLSGATYDMLLPVELTHELLESCGIKEKEKPYSMLCSHFIMMGNNGCIRKKCARWITENLSGSKIEKPFLRVDGICDIYYLHHLQNIWHSLTGEELTINL